MFRNIPFWMYEVSWFLTFINLRQQSLYLFIDFFLIFTNLRDLIFAKYSLVTAALNIIIAIIAFAFPKTLIKICCLLHRIYQTENPVENRCPTLHITWVRKPRRNKQKVNTKLSQVISSFVCRNNYGKEDTILSFISKLSVYFVFFCFQMAFRNKLSVYIFYILNSTYFQN